MSEQIFKIIENNLGVSVLITVVVLITFIFLVIWAVKIYYKVKKIDELPCDEHKSKMDTITKVQTQMSDLPCVDHKDSLKEHGKKFDDILSKMSDTNSKISKIETSITFMQSSITELSNNIQKLQSSGIFSMKSSPRKLNAQGMKVFTEINGEQFLAENKKFFFDEIEALKPQTRLDVENAANYVCHSSTGSVIFNRLKDFVYNYPSMEFKDENGNTRRYDLTLGDICFIIGLPLRDMYLEEHPDIG